MFVLLYFGLEFPDAQQSIRSIKALPTPEPLNGSCLPPISPRGPFHPRMTASRPAGRSHCDPPFAFREVQAADHDETSLPPFFLQDERRRRNDERAHHPRRRSPRPIRSANRSRSPDHNPDHQRRFRLFTTLTNALPTLVLLQRRRARRGRILGSILHGPIKRSLGGQYLRASVVEHKTYIIIVYLPALPVPAKKI